MITKPTKTSSSKVALLIAGILVVILIAAVSAIIFLLIKNFDNKDMVQSETTNQSVSEEVVQKDEINQNEKVQNDSMDDEVNIDKKEENAATSSDKQELNSSVKYIFLPSIEKAYNANGNTVKESLYEWDYYKSPTDNKVLVKEKGALNTQSEMIIERKNNIGEVSIKTNFMQEGEMVNKLEFYDNTTVVLKLATIIKQGEQAVSEVEDVEIIEKKQGDKTLLEINNKKENILKKIQINPDGTVSEDLYVNNELFKKTLYENYYYNGVLVTTLFKSDHYANGKVDSLSELKVTNVEEDENSVKISLKNEMSANGNTVVAFKSEYILKKYVLEEDGTVTPIDEEE